MGLCRADKVVVVTGASSGIAKACALQLASQGAKLILAARRLKELSEVAQECNNIAGQKSIASIVVADVSIEEDCKYAFTGARGVPSH